MPSQQVVDCVQLLANRRLTFAFVESVTAGRLAAEFALTQATDDCLLGGIVCYHVDTKKNLLHIPAALIEQFTPESPEVTQAITQSLNNHFKTADILVGVTGLAWAGGSETEAKPVGSMFFHLIIQGRHYSHQAVFNGSAENLILQAIDQVAVLIMQYVNSHSS